MAEQAGEKVMWFVAGATVGAAIALLYAPLTGQELRKQIGAKAADGSNALADGGRQLLDRGRDLYDKGRQIADDAADMFEQGKNMVQSKVEEGAKQAKQTVNRVVNEAQS